MTGFAVLFGSYARRDWWQVLAWAIGISALYGAQAVSVESLYTTQSDLDTAADTLGSNLAFVAMAGPARGLDTVGGQVFWQSSAFGAVLVGLMAMFLVARHTRAEEESGRDELVRAAPVGRFASVSAAAAVAVVACAVVGASTTAALLAYGLPGADSAASGVGLAFTGAVFSGVALVAVQLAGTVRGAYGITGVVLAGSYALRAIGDVTDNGLRWLSPIGWYQALHPFSGVRWWPTALLLVAVAMTAAVAYAIFLRRDLGAGVLRPRPGPARGRVHSGLRLTWRLQRSALAGWTTGLLLTGLAYGSIGDQVGDVIGDPEASQKLFSLTGADPVDSFYATALVMIALLGTGFTISSALRLRGEEESDRTDLLLSTGLSSARWAMGHAAITTVGTVLVMVAGGVGIGVGYGAATGDWAATPRLASPVLGHVVPAFFCAAVAWFLVGMLPRFSRIAWVLLGWSAVVLLLGDSLRMPGWLRALSPFDHLAAAPVETFAVAPVLVVSALGLCLALGALVALGRRDLG